MKDTQDLEDAILTMADEDWYGLYEVIGHMNSAQPGLAESVKIDAARQAIRSLVQRHEIRLGWLTWPEGGPPSSIEDSEALKLLEDPTSWQPSQRYIVLFPGPARERAV